MTSIPWIWIVFSLYKQCAIAAITLTELKFGSFLADNIATCPSGLTHKGEEAIPVASWEN